MNTLQLCTLSTRVNGLVKVFCYGSDCKVCLTRQSDRLQAENANATEAISDFDLVTTVAQCGATTW